MSQPERLRDILQRTGLLDGEPGPKMKLYSWRCAQCGTLQHQVMPASAPAPACIVKPCREPFPLAVTLGGDE